MQRLLTKHQQKKIPQHVKNILYQEQLEFIWEFRVCSTSENQLKYYTIIIEYRAKTHNHIIVIGKAFDKTQHINNKKLQQSIRGIYSSNKIIYEKPMSNIVLNDERQYVPPKIKN